MKKIIYLIIFLLMIGIVGAVSYTFKQNEDINLNIPCVDEIEQPCDSNINCNITILYQNGTVFVDNQPMTRQETYYNYTIPSIDTETIGEYSSSIFCAGTANGFSTFSFEITSSGIKTDKGSLGGFSIAIILSLIAAAAVAFFVGHSFKNEDQKWYHLILRAIFYMFSIGFVGLAIGALNQLSAETGITDSTAIGKVITGGVILISRMQYFFWIIIFIIATLTIIYNVLQYKKSKSEKQYGKY